MRKGPEVSSEAEAPRKARNALWLLLSLVVVVLDLWTKSLAQGALAYGEFVPVLPFFNLTLAYNPGAAFSFLADAGGWQRYFFTVVAVVAVLIMLVWLLRLKGEKIVACSLALVIGGALGNLYDRVVLGHVVDFLDFYWGVYHFPAFNLADSAITLGAVLLIIDMLFAGKRGDE
jgi:signal peptidase II